jgi:hypothetical protein
MWWDVVYGQSNLRVEGWWAHTDTQKSDTIVLAVPIALTLKVKMNCIAILALLCCTWWLRCGGLWWVVAYGRVTWDWDWNWNANGHTKTNKHCDWSNTKVLAVPIALTMKAKMNCSADLALLCCTWWLRCVVDYGGLWRTSESCGSESTRLMDTRTHKRAIL